MNTTVTTGHFLESVSLATTSDRIKIVVSSRPIPACVDTFSHAAGLRLQDLTLCDIQLYVKDRLLSYTLIKNVEQREAGVTNTLVDEIVSKTFGSFLWAVLILRLLSFDFGQGHTISEILQAVREVPLAPSSYELTLGSRHESHQVSAAIIIQPVIHAFEVQESYAITRTRLASPLLLDGTCHPSCLYIRPLPPGESTLLRHHLSQPALEIHHAALSFSSWPLDCTLPYARLADAFWRL